MAAIPLLLGYLACVLSRAHFEAPPPTPILYDRQGVFVAQFGDAVPGRHGESLTEYGYWPAEPPPARIVHATLALEDRRFWSHPGVDPGAVLRAAWQDLSGLRRRSGASTIAMQVARMQHPAARSLWAKAVEAGTALALTVRYGRAAVLAQYLRLVPYGNGSHGIGHAARWYFDKPAADLSWAEIAVLCAVPRAPAAYNPLHPTGLQRARVRAGRILAALRGQAVISEAEYQAATAQLATLRPGPAPHRPADALHPILRLGDLLAQRSPPSPPSDDRVTTSLDLGVQHAVATLLRERLAAWHEAGAQQAAAMVVQRGSNAVLAAVGSGAYADPRGGAIDFTRAVRSPGSTLKPFLYAAALQRGLLHPADMLLDGPGRSAGIGNADGRYLGPLPPRQALANSRNVPAVDVLRRLGLGSGFALFDTLGLRALNALPDSLGLAMAIGAMPTSLDRLAGAYTALADDGVEHALVWYRGQPVLPPRRVFSATAAREVGLFLSDPLARLPSFARYGSTEYPFAVAVKTGTSQGYRDAWTAAWSAQFLVVAWVGRSDAGTMARLGGANSAAELVRAILLTLQHAVPGDLADTSFAVPEGYLPAPVCAAPAETPQDGCGRTLLEWVPGDRVATAAAGAPEASAMVAGALVPGAGVPGAGVPWESVIGRAAGRDPAAMASGVGPASGASPASGAGVPPARRASVPAHEATAWAAGGVPAGGAAGTGLAPESLVSMPANEAAASPVGKVPASGAGGTGLAPESLVSMPANEAAASPVGQVPAGGAVGAEAPPEILAAMPAGASATTAAPSPALSGGRSAPALAASMVRLSVVTPEAGSRVWHNPESPPAVDRLVLRASAIPHVPQVVWYVDGEPFALSDPDVPVTWPLRVGEHRFQIGLPLRPERSRPVRLMVD